MKAARLVCKGCSAVYPLEALFACDRCFGPLEVGYDDVDAPVSRADVEAGPPTLWRYADFLPVAPPAGGLPVGRSPLIRADRLAAELGLDCDLYVKTETSNPTHSFKDRVVAVAAAKAVELGYEALACASTGNLAGATAAAAAALGPPGLHLRARRSRAREDRRRRRVRRDGVRRGRLLRRREPAVLGARLRAPVGVREREHARLLLGGVEDDRPRDGRGSGLARARPRRGADRVGLALHEDPSGVPRGPGRRAVGARARSGHARRPGRGLRAGRHGVRRRMPTRSCPSGRGASPSRSRSATRRRRVRARRRPVAPAARSSRPTTRSSSTASGCSRGRRGSSPRPPAASRRRSSGVWRSGARSRRARPSSPTSPATA